MLILQVVIGIIFVLLLLSLLATTVMELLAAGLSLRGKNLEKALKNLLASTDIDEHVLQGFKDNALYRQLSYRFGKKRYPPSYMGDDTFQSILFDVILKGDQASVGNLKKQIETVPDQDLKDVLKQLMQDSEENLDQFRVEVKKWYNNIMDRASGWYKKTAQKMLVGIGLAIAVIFNADTIALYQHLASNPQSVDQLVALAEKFVDEEDGSGLVQQDREFEEAYSNLQNLINNEVNKLNQYGIGWNDFSLDEIDESGWAIKVLGWLVTALAISLGAPFWFDLLRKVVNIRNAGKSPNE